MSRSSWFMQSPPGDVGSGRLGWEWGGCWAQCHPAGMRGEAGWCKDGGDRSSPGYHILVLHGGTDTGHAGRTDVQGHTGMGQGDEHGRRGTQGYRPSTRRDAQRRDTGVQAWWHCARRWMRTQRHTRTWTPYIDGDGPSMCRGTWP